MLLHIEHLELVDLVLEYDGNTVWHAGNDGAGSGHDLVDGLQASSFIRSDTNDNVSGHTEWQDNFQIRFGNDADFRIYFNGKCTKMLMETIFQSDNTSGTTQPFLD